MEPGVEIGRRLADLHQARVETDPVQSLINYAERPRNGDWSMRSALVRLAQSEPELVSAVLELVRRLDAVLHHVARSLEAHTTMCHWDMTIEALEPSDKSVDQGGGRGALDPSREYGDARVTDVARVTRLVSGEGEAVVEGYSQVDPLSTEELKAIPLLEVALVLDDLADRLVDWAVLAPAPAPTTELVDVCQRVRSRLDELEVPEETAGPAGPGGRS